MTRSIIHIDMDAFFASVEQRDNPAYRNQPVIVGGKKGSRGVVSTASYEARKFGVHSAMSMAEAVRRCPNGIYLPVDMEKYHSVSTEIMAIFKRFTPLVEAVSLDEAFLDVTESRLLFGEATEIARKIKEMIAAEINLTASVGIAGNKFLAKLASEMGKPNGFYEIKDSEIEDKVWPLPIQKMLGVGKKTAQQLLKMRVNTIGALAKSDPLILEKIFGKQGILLYNLANGIDNRPVEATREVKSIGRETTFQEDITDSYYLETVLMALTEDVSRTMRQKHYKGRTIHLKVRYDDFSTISRSVTLTNYTANFEPIFGTVRELFRKHYTKKRPVRLIGMSVSHLSREDEIAEQLQFFVNDNHQQKQDKLDGVLDDLNKRFGAKTITRAREIALCSHHEIFEDSQE